MTTERPATAAGRYAPELENEMLRGIVKVLCAGETPYGSDAFARAKATLNNEHRALLLEVLSD